MKKSQAIELLGGTVPKAAEALGVTYQAVDKWPDDLPLRISDRVLGAYTRLHGVSPHTIDPHAEPVADICLAKAAASPAANDPQAPQPAEQGVPHA